MTTTTETATLKTRVHAYCYYIDKPEDKAAYDALKTKMAAQGTECFETWGGGTHYLSQLDGREVELETKHLFDNQWNTAPIPGVSDKGYRVFDWAQDYQEGTKQKKGHWLELTPEMIEARENRVACGYCGEQYARADAPRFCPKCLGSEYLKPTDLHLLRIAGLGFKAKRAELSPEERAELLPIYEARQRGEGDARAVAARAKYAARVEETYQEKTSEAKTEYDAQTWLLAQGANMRVLQNVIYYKHKDLFTFGWREPMNGADLDWLLAHLSEFPFEYTIKTKDRGELGGRE